MASDLKIEIFASQFFGDCWHRAGYLSEKPKISSLYPEGYDLDPENANIYEYSHFQAVYIKHIFYNYLIYDELIKLHAQFEPSPSYISDLISRTCGRDGLFGDLPIFELLLTSCAFVIQLSVNYIRTFCYKDIVTYVHLCWAMYFDEYKKEFYSQGGWNRLKIVSLSYVLPYDFLFTYLKNIFQFPEIRRDILFDFLKTVVNYKTFSSRIHANCETISKAWVKRPLQNFNKSDDFTVRIDQTERQDMENPKVIENFLFKFRSLCDPNVAEVLNVKAQHKFIDSCKQYTKETPQSLLKLNNLTLNDMIASQQSDAEVKEIELQVTDHQTDPLIAVNLPRKESTDQTNQLNGTYLPRNKNTISNASESDASRNNSFLKLKMSSSNIFPMFETQGTRKQKPNEETKKEIDLERENAEVKCLLKMILVLGNPDGMIHLLSSLSRSDTNKSKKESKKKLAVLEQFYQG
ncbi:uncharacterized protein TNIN_139921 [Trichonephila inaurata madagascariensis]|uniref:Uncharacterized protein n=1 Tax=Trichonephila inaurata madagascariensis TaxID=2747483 RepID=A0A8X6XQW8_9ARAC|nr:uncharacterized protein TNIN_139921 [Trichonephila inaurata madagascariensis]